MNDHEPENLDDRSTDREEVLANAARAASGLDAIGVQEGDAVALLLRNDFAFIEATQACALLGAYCVPINWHGKADDVSYILDDVKAKISIAHADLIAPASGSAAARPDRSGRADAERGSGRLGKTAVLPDDTIWPNWLSDYAPWVGELKAKPCDVDLHVRHNGTPKGVKRQPSTPDQMSAYTELMRTVYGVTKIAAF